MQFNFFSSIFFVCSGFTALIYQSVWSKYFGLIFGHSALAQTIVLAIFMGGMGLGAWLAGRFDKRIVSALKTYAIAELLIGLMAFTFHRVYLSSSDSLHAALPALGSLAMTAKAALGVLLVGPQCILLGATFPILSRAVSERTDQRPGKVLSSLYFANSAGAAFGALASIFYFIPSAGLPGTLIFAGAMNLLIACAAILISNQFSAGSVNSLATVQTKNMAHSLPLYSLLVIAGVSGACSFVYEIGWIRLLILAQGSSAYSFEIMLSSFIFGLSFGAFLCRFVIVNVASLQSAASKFQILKGLAVLISIMFYLYSFPWVAGVNSILVRSDQSYAAFLIGSSAVSFLIMFVPATFAGFTLPIFTTLALAASRNSGVVGRIYAWNTFGAIVGIFASTHFLIELVGVKGMLIVAACVDIGCGIYLANRKSLGFWDKGLWVACGLALILAVNVRYAPEVLSSGSFRYDRSTLESGNSVIFMKDGKTSTISVLKSADSYSILTNGKPDAALRVKPDGPAQFDEITMTFAAAIPMAYVTRAKHAAVIGWGSGMSSSVLAASGVVDKVTTIEIERQMYEGSKKFQYLLEPGFSSKKLEIIFDDAKSYFYGTREKFDVVMSEPSNPWVSGVANLFSEEFYSLVNSKLTDDGVLVQWIQAYEFNDRLLISILKALDKNFADYHVYAVTGSVDIMIVASKRKLAEPRLPTDPYLKTQFERLSISNLADLKSFWIGDRALLSAFLKRSSVPANSDFFPTIELSAPKAMFKQENTFLQSLRSNLDFPIFRLLAPEFESTSATLENTLGRRRAHALALLGLLESPSAIPQSLQKSAMLSLYLDLPVESACPTDDETAIQLLRQHLSFVNAALYPDEAARLWEKVKFCNDRPIVKKWLNLFTAVGVGDSDQAKSLATELLNSKSPLAKDYLYKSSAFASFAMGDCEGTKKTLVDWKSQNLQATVYDNYFFQLLDDCEVSKPTVH